jgi:hypothetical protein
MNCVAVGPETDAGKSTGSRAPETTTQRLSDDVTFTFLQTIVLADATERGPDAATDDRALECRATVVFQDFG